MPLLLRANGLYTYKNELSVPEGSLEIADNVVIDEDGVIEPRRGFGDYGTVLPSNNDRLKQILTYKGRIIRHFNDILQFDSNSGAFVNFLGSFTETEVGRRLRNLEVNGNLYFTTDNGIKKLSVKSSDDIPLTMIIDAGGVKATGINATTVLSAGGFLPAQSKVAYRVVFGSKDANNNLILGVPSSRFVLANTTQDVNIQESFTIEVQGVLTEKDYVTFSSKTTDYFVWFKKPTGTATAPQTAQTIGRTEIVAVVSATVNTTADAAAIGNAIAQYSDFKVEVNSSFVTVTVVAPGNVDDAIEPAGMTNIAVTVSQGSVVTGAAANVSLDFILPEGIDSTNYFYQIYRTAVAELAEGLTLDEIDPGDEMNLAFENAITDLDLESRYIIVEDLIPDLFRQAGVPLYTNPITGQGILQANERPPISKDIALFRGATFFSNTKTSHKLSLNLTGITDIVSRTHDFIIANKNVTRTYTFVGVKEKFRIKCDTVAATTQNSVILLNSANNEYKYYVHIDKTGSGTDPLVSGREKIYLNLNGLSSAVSVATKLSSVLNLVFDLTAQVVNTDEVEVTLYKSGISDDPIFGTPAPGGIWAITVDTQGDGEGLSGIISSYTSGTTITITSTAHGLITGDIIGLSGTDVDGQYTVTRLSSSTFQITSAIASVGGTSSRFYQNEVLLSSQISLGSAIDETARSMVDIINKDPLSPVNAFYLSGADDLPGQMLLENRNLEDVPFYLSVNDPVISPRFDPSVPAIETITNIVLSAGVNSNARINVPNTFSAGNKVVIIETDTTPIIQGLYTIVSATPTYFIIDFKITAGSISSNGEYFLPTVASDNEISPNRVMFSKTQQPESVPIVNYLDVGPRDKEIHRVLALRDNLFVLKEDGVYIITGPSAPNFSVRLLDGSTPIIAPDTAVVLNNQIYALSTQGVVSITETGVSIISRPIEDKILGITNPRFNFKFTAFGVAYESDRSYLMWLPKLSTDTVATQCYRYNTFTQTWTRLILTSTCGIVNINDDKLYIGDGTKNILQQERKDRDRKDYSDRRLDKTLIEKVYTGNTFSINSTSDVATGDVITQSQYVTISILRRFLCRLDIDFGFTPPVNGFEGTYLTLPGGRLDVSLTELATELNSQDPSITATTFSIDFTTMKDQYNQLINELNAEASLSSFSDYKIIEETTEYETVIIGQDDRISIVTVNVVVPLVQGPLSVYKAYQTIVQYSPQHFGDAAMLKQVRDGTFIFDQTSFYGGTVAYASDQSPSFDEVIFETLGPGDWGGGTWGEATWGGLGDDVPLRTLIPLDKQRCRYLTCRFSHINAREPFKLLGVSLEPRQLSKRAYRR